VPLKFQLGTVAKDEETGKVDGQKIPGRRTGSNWFAAAVAD